MQSFKPIMRETVLDVKHCRNQVYLLLLMMLDSGVGWTILPVFPVSTAFKLLLIFPLNCS